MTSPSMPPMMSTKRKRTSGRKTSIDNVSQIVHGVLPSSNSRPDKQYQHLRLQRTGNYIPSLRRVRKFGGSDAAVSYQEESLANEPIRISEAYTGDASQTEEIKYAGGFSPYISEALPGALTNIVGRGSLRAFETDRERVWPWTKPEERMPFVDRRTGSEFPSIVPERRMLAGDIVAPIDPLSHIEPDDLGTVDHWPTIPSPLWSGSGRIEAVAHGMASRPVWGFPEGVSLGVWPIASSPRIREFGTGAFTSKVSLVQDPIVLATLEASQSQSPAPQLEEALSDLEQVIGDAREDEFVEPTQFAIDKAGLILRRIYTISPRRYEVYPMPEGDVVIDGAGQYDRWVMLMVRPDSRILCVVGIDGNERHKYYEDMGSLLTDTFLCEALDELGDEG